MKEGVVGIARNRGPEGKRKKDRATKSCTKGKRKGLRESESKIGARCGGGREESPFQVGVESAGPGGKRGEPS